MKIPDKIKIGGITYTVELKDEEYLSKDKNAIVYGEIIYNTDKITIGGDKSKDTTKKIFLHEVLHGIARIYGVHFSAKDDEEAIIESFAQGLYQTIVDNPEVFEGNDNDKI